MQVVNTLLDRGFIGHLHSASLTAHGASANVMFMMFSLAVAVATGATALVSRAFGAQEHQELRQASQESLGLAVFGGILICALTVLIATPSANWILPDSAVDAKREMASFVSAYALGLPAIFVIQVLAGSLRGIGDTKSPMVISGIQILLHITLNFILIFPPRHLGSLAIPGANLGLLGAACALAGSATVSAIAYLCYIRFTPLGALTPFRVPRWHWVVRIMRIAVPAGVMATLRVLSLTAFTLVLKEVPNAETAIAAMGISIAIESIMFMPAFGLSAAAAALVGQSLGMKRPDRAENLAWTAGGYGLLVTLALAIPIYINAPHISDALLGDKRDIALQATILLRYLCTTEFLFGLAMVLLGAMQGAGDTVRPLWISLCSLWGLRVPLAVILALPKNYALFGSIPLPFALGMGAGGAWLAMAGTQGLQGILALIAFKQGAWKAQKV